MHIKNIEIEHVTQINRVHKKIKKYLENKGVKVFKMEIVRNRFVDTTVGCRVTIKESQKEELEKSDFWPEGIECRAWGKKYQFNKYRQQRRDMYDMYNERDEDDRNSWRYGRYEDQDRYDDRYDDQYEDRYEDRQEDNRYRHSRY